MGEPGALRAPGLAKGLFGGKTGVRNFYRMPRLIRVQGHLYFLFIHSQVLMRRHFLSSFFCLFVCIPALAQERRVSLFYGPSHNYYCSAEQEIMSMSREQLNRQRSQSVSNQQNIARYLELEQKRRAVLEQELGRINRQFP